MLLQCWIVVLNDAKVSQNAVLKVSPACCVLQCFFKQCFTVTSMRAGLPYMGMPARAHSAVPASSHTLLRHNCTMLCALGITDRTKDRNQEPVPVENR